MSTSHRFISASLAITTLIILAMAMPKNARAQGAVAWRSTGGPEVGSLSALAADAAGRTIAAAPFGGGVLFRAENMPWQVWNNGLPDPYVSALAASGEWWYAAVRNSGVYGVRATDWAWMGRSNGLPSKTVNQLFGQADGSVLAVVQDSGLYVLRSGYSIWQRTGTGFPRGVSARFAEGGGTVWAATSNGVYSSSDGAATWADRSAGLPGRQAEGGIALTATGTVLVGIPPSGVFRSGDGGATWTMVDTAGNGPKNVRAIAANASGDVLIASIQGVFASTNNGATFSRRVTGAAWEAFYTFVPMQGRVFVGWSETDGLWSGDATGSWSRFADGFMGARIYSLLSVKRGAETTIWSGSNNGWLHSASAPTGPWAGTPLLQQVTSGYIDDICVTGTGAMLVATASGVFRAPTATAVWTRVLRGPSTVALLQSSGGPLYAGAQNAIRVSTDDGLTWSTSDTLPQTSAYPACFADVGGTRVAAGIGASPYGGGVRIRDVNGGTWMRCGSGLDTTSVTALCFARDRLVAGTWGRGVFALDAADSVWKPLGTGITNLFINDLVMGNNAEIYAATWGGGVCWLPWQSSQAWQAWNQGLPNLFITALEKEVGDGIHLYAGTQGNSVYVTTVATPGAAVPAAAPLEARLETPAPHPARGETMIRFSVRVSGNTCVTVHDLLGRTVAVLQNGSLTAGGHELRWDVSPLPAGTYILRLEQDGRVTARVCRVAWAQ